MDVWMTLRIQVCFYAYNEYHKHFKANDLLIIPICGLCMVFVAWRNSKACLLIAFTHEDIRPNICVTQPRLVLEAA